MDEHDHIAEGRRSTLKSGIVRYAVAVAMFLLGVGVAIGVVVQDSEPNYTPFNYVSQWLVSNHLGVLLASWTVICNNAIEWTVAFAAGTVIYLFARQHFHLPLFSFIGGWLSFNFYTLLLSADMLGQFSAAFGFDVVAYTALNDLVRLPMAYLGAVATSWVLSRDRRGPSFRFSTRDLLVTMGIVALPLAAVPLNRGTATTLAIMISASIAAYLIAPRRHSR